MRDTQCSERAELEGAVVDAVRAVYDARSEDHESLRRIERAAVKALQQHVEAHGYDRVKGSDPVAR
jgi:hypothetical protein